MSDAREVFKRWFQDRYGDSPDVPEGDTEEWLSFLSALHSAGMKVLSRTPPQEVSLEALSKVKPDTGKFESMQHLWEAMFDAALPATQGGER